MSFLFSGKLARVFQKKSRQISINLPKYYQIFPNIPKSLQISPNLRRFSVTHRRILSVSVFAVIRGWWLKAHQRIRGAAGASLRARNTQTIPSKQSDVRSFGESNGRFISGTIIRFATLDERFENETRERDAKRRGLQQTFTVYMQRGGL